MTTTALPAPADLNLSLTTLLTVVSMAARNRSLQAIADATTLPIAVVDRIARHYGAPNLGALADQAAALRRHLDEEKADTEPRRGKDALAELRETAQAIGSARLVNRADWLVGKVAELRTDVEQAVAAHNAAADEQRKRDAAKAEIVKLRKRIAALQKEAGAGHPHNSTSSAESALVRAWAKEQGLLCAASGKIPGRIRGLYEKAHQ